MPTSFSINKKPSFRDIIAAAPFALHMVFEADRRSFVVLAISGFAEGPLGAVSVIALKLFVDALTAQQASLAWKWFGVLLFVSAGYGVVSYLRERYSDYMRFHTETALKAKTLAYLSAVPYAVLEDANFQSLASMQENKSYILQNLQNALVRMVAGLFSVLGLFSVFAFIPWPATVLFLLAQGVRLYFLQQIREWSWNVLSMETQEGRRGVYYQETLSKPSSALLARSLDLARPMYRRWKDLIDKILRSKLKSSDAMARSDAWGSVFETLGLALALFLITRNVLLGLSAVSVAVVFISTYQRFQQSFARLVGEVNWIYKESSYLPVLQAFFSYPIEPDVGKALPREPLIVKFEEVYFHYPGSSQDILRGLNLMFTEGEHIALAGLNGAGKSTLLKLLMRVYEPTKGRITVNGIDLKAIKPSVWRQALSVLSQGDVVFDDVISQQVRYGALDQALSKSRYRMALETSGLGDVAQEFPKGLETHAGKQYAMPEENAIELSGGQRQIVAIARTLYRDAKIYIFDEPTSAVDAEKEERFFAALPEVLQEQAVIYVSHRFSVLRRAERIIVIDQGRVIEDGTHEELMAKEGRYAELFVLQAKMYQ